MLERHWGKQEAANIKTEFCICVFTDLMCNRYCWLTTTTPIPFFFFFSLAFLHFGNAEAKSLFFSDSVFTIDDPVTPFWPVSHKYWSLSVLPLLFPPSCCLEHRSHPRTVSVVSKDDRTEKQASCFLVALLSSYTPPRPSCLPTYDLLLHKSFAI